MSNRADKKKNVDKVAAAIAVNPLATQRDLAAATGLGLASVNRNKKEAEQNGTKDDRIIHLTDGDFELQKKIQEIKAKKLRENADKISDSDINQWDRHSMTRYTTFRGDATNEDGGLNGPVVLTWET